MLRFIFLRPTIVAIINYNLSLGNKYRVEMYFYLENLLPYLNFMIGFKKNCKLNDIAIFFSPSL